MYRISFARSFFSFDDLSLAVRAILSPLFVLQSPLDILTMKSAFALAFSCLSVLPLVAAHGRLRNIRVDGQLFVGPPDDQQPAIRAVADANPVHGADNRDINCGRNATPAATTVSANPGSVLEFNWKGDDNSSVSFLFQSAVSNPVTNVLPFCSGPTTRARCLPIWPTAARIVASSIPLTRSGSRSIKLDVLMVNPPSGCKPS